MADFRPFSPRWGDISFTEAPQTTARCYAGAIFLSYSPSGRHREPAGVEGAARHGAWPRCPWAAAGPGRASARPHTKCRRCGGCRRDRRARAGFEIDTSEPSGSRVEISRAAGPDGARNTSGATRPPGYAKGAGTEVPAPCRFTQPLPRRGLRPDDRQSWRRRRIHRNMPPTTAAPRPAPPIRPSKPVRARPFFGLVAGTSGAT